MKIIFVGGGTAGHINPALAVATYVKEREPDTDILYVGNKGGMEEKLVPEAGFSFKGINISGFSRKISLASLKKNLVTIKKIFVSSRESRKILQEFKPDICMGTGGYVSGPFLREAMKLGIPVIIHEQNAYPGMTTKLLSKKANKVMLANMDAKKYLNNRCKVEVTGNPIRGDILKFKKGDVISKFKFDDKPIILSFGGSLGARRVNEAVAELINWSTKNNMYNHIHAYGQYGKWFKDLLLKKGVDVENNKSLDIREYIKDMPACMAAADIIICRAGAVTLSEIEAMGKPSILIPSPNVSENHQYYNALSLVSKNAACMIEEKNLSGESLIEEVKKITKNKEMMALYEKNCKSMAITDANERIYKIIKSEVQSKNS